MSSTLQQWKSELANLPEAERAELAQYLLDSLEVHAKAEWLALAKDRMADVHAGRVVGIPAEEVLKSLRRPKP